MGPSSQLGSAGGRAGGSVAGACSLGGTCGPSAHPRSARPVPGPSSCGWAERLSVGRATGKQTGANGAAGLSVVRIHASKSGLLCGRTQHAGNRCVY